MAVTTDSLRIIQNRTTLREMTADRLREAMVSMHSRRCAMFVERSADFALQVLKTEPAAAPPQSG